MSNHILIQVREKSKSANNLDVSIISSYAYNESEVSFNDFIKYLKYNEYLYSKQFIILSYSKIPCIPLMLDTMTNVITKDVVRLSLEHFDG